MTQFDSVKEFNVAYEIEDLSEPGFPGAEVERLRLNLIAEEFKEYVTALISGDLVEITDALADLLYVLNGTALHYGVNLDAVFAEVHRSNMSKLAADGTPIRRPDGKVLKGPNYSRPDLESVGVPAIFRGTPLDGVEEILRSHGLA